MTLNTLLMSIVSIIFIASASDSLYNISSSDMSRSVYGLSVGKTIFSII